MKTVSYSRLMHYVILLIFSLFLNLPQVLRAKELNAMDLGSEFEPIRSLTQLDADFTQTRTITKWQTEISTSGHLKVIHRPQKSMVWEILEPSYMALKMADSHFFTRSSKTSTWKRMEKSKAQKHIQSLLTWMSFDGKKISQEYHVYKIGPGKYNMTPKNKKSIFNNMEMNLTKNHLPSEFFLFDRLGDQIHIQFKNTKVKK